MGSLINADDEPGYRDRFYDREVNPRDYYVDVDQRKPHSVTDKEEAAGLRENYAGLQPSISAKSSDTQDSHAHRRLKKACPESLCY